MKTLVVEGWRTSCHSYALVNQQQLLHLVDEPKFKLYHRDVRFFNDAWSRVDSGLPQPSKMRLQSIPSPPPALRADVTYRISYPFRIHEGDGRVLIFATNELGRSLPDDCVGADGRPDTVDPASVEIVTPSGWSRRAFLEAGYPPDRVHIVPHGMDPGFAAPIGTLQRQALRQQLGLGEDSFAFLNVGAMSWNKGVGPLIAAFAVHRRSFPNSVLILKGGDSLYGNVLRQSCEEACRLRPESRDLGVVQNLRHIRANLSLGAIAALYRSSDAYISSYRAEGFNLPVLEAMASDLPAIVTRGGSTEDFCPDDTCLKIDADLVSGEAGMHLEPDIDSIVEQMERMVVDSQGRVERSLRAREHVLPRFTWGRITEQLSGLLRG